LQEQGDSDDHANDDEHKRGSGAFGDPSGHDVHDDDDEYRGVRNSNALRQVILLQLIEIRPRREATPGASFSRA
jgi:hypothetical protein